MNDPISFSTFFSNFALGSALALGALAIQAQWNGITWRAGFDQRRLFQPKRPRPLRREP